MKSPISSGAMPAFSSSPATFTWSSTSRRRVLLEPAQRRIGRDRVDQAHARRDVLHLAALERADEVPLEQVAVGVLLRGQLLSAVLADQGDPGLGQRRQVLERHVLDRGADLGPRPRSRSRTRSRFARTRSASRRATPGLPGGRSRRRRAGARRRGPRGSSCTGRRARRAPRPRRAAAPRRSPRRSSIRPSAKRAPKCATHLVTDLVAALPDPRPDGRGGRLVEARDAPPRRSRRPARASRSAPSPIRSAPASATGRQSATRTSRARSSARGHVPVDAVERRPVGAGVPRLHVGPVDLPAHRDRGGVDARGLGQQLAVSLHPAAVVVGQDAQVERLVRARR